MKENEFPCSNCGKPNSVQNTLCKVCQAEADATLAPTPNVFGDATMAPSSATSAETGDPLNRPVGDYDLIEEIARGGMGVVYKANHRNLNRITALKMILGGRFSSAEELRRFQVEAESAAKLDHPAIVPIFEIGECDGQAFFAMKYVDGGSLAEKAETFKSRPREAAELLIKVCEAVHHAHQRGILHRDLKPANILLDTEGLPYVTDLGLAKSTSGESDLTHTGAVLGTPRYMPPEQASGKVVTTAADIYALGAILYELISGKAPYDGENSLSVVIQVIDGPPEPPSKLNPAVDRDLELICLKCIHRDPENRYPSAQALADDLRAWLDGLMLSVKPPSTRARIASWIKQNQRLANAAFAVFFGVLLCTPLVLTFFSNDLATAYDPFPSEQRPWMYSITVPNFVSVLFAVVLFLIIWPSIGLLNKTNDLVTITDLRLTIECGPFADLLCFRWLDDHHSVGRQFPESGH